MIKFICHSKDNPHQKMLGIGLSEKNLEYLKAGKPIEIKPEEILETVSGAFIFYGKTERDMCNELKAAGVSFPEQKFSDTEEDPKCH